MFLSHLLWWPNLTLCKYLLVSLYLICTSWYQKLLTNNRRTVSVAFPFPQNWCICFILNTLASPKLVFFKVFMFCFQALPDVLLPQWCWAAWGPVSYLTWASDWVLLWLSHQQGPVQRRCPAHAQECATMARHTLLPSSSKAQSPSEAYTLHMGKINVCWGGERAEEQTCLWKPMVMTGEFVWGRQDLRHAQGEGLEHNLLCVRMLSLGHPCSFSLLFLVFSSAMKRGASTEVWALQVTFSLGRWKVLRCLEQESAFSHLNAWAGYWPTQTNKKKNQKYWREESMKTLGI